MKRLLRKLGHRCALPAPARSTHERCWCGQRWVSAFVPLFGWHWYEQEREVRL